MATNYLGMLGQGANAWYGEKKFDQARDDIKGGFDTARKNVKKYQEPYTEFGLEQMGQFQARPDFKYGMEEFEASPGYQFRQDEAAKQIQRSNAAQKMLASGNTLATLTQRSQDIAKDEFQAGYERSLNTYKTNDQRNQWGTELGAGMAKNLGDNLADIGIGEGISLASLNGMQAKRMSEIISSTLAAAGQPSDPNTISGMINDALSKGVDTVGGFLKETVMGKAVGAAKDYALGALGGAGGAATTASTVGSGSAGYNALQGGYGSLSTILGEGGATAAGTGATAGVEAGTAAAGAEAAVAGSFGSWAGSVVPALGAMFALMKGVEMLRGESRWEKVLGGMPKNGDPIKYIQNIDSQKMPDIGGKYHESKPTETRGALYETIFEKLPDDQLQAMKYHDNIGQVVTDLLAYNTSGYSGGGAGSAVLERLFPEIAGNIKSGQFNNQFENTTDYMDRTEADGNTSINRAMNQMREQQFEALKRGQPKQYAKKGIGYIDGVNVRRYMLQKVRQWNGEKAAGNIVQELS